MNILIFGFPKTPKTAFYVVYFCHYELSNDESQKSNFSSQKRSKFEILTFFDLKNLIIDLRHLTARSGKSITHRRLFLVSLESQSSKYLFGIKFWVVGGLLGSSMTTSQNPGQIDPPPSPGNVCSRPRPE